MRLPAPLLRLKPDVHKNQYGHILIIAGSRNMLGASALCGLAAMRSGAGLVTLAVPQSLNTSLQKKISPVLMTFPLKETSAQSFSTEAFGQLQKRLQDFDVIVIGPGLSQHPGTEKFILKVITTVPQPLLIDADALNALTKKPKLLTWTSTAMILTPHPGEMSRLIGTPKKSIEQHRNKVSQEFARQYHCVLLLKGHRTIVAGPNGESYTNTTGNAGMATAGSGDVLAGIIAALLGQGLTAFEAAKCGAYLHGKAGDLAARERSKAAMIATDIIDHIPQAIKKSG